METVKVAISEMTANQLNWALATLLKHEILIGEAGGVVFVKKSYGWQNFCPATASVQAGPLIDKYGVSACCLYRSDKQLWQAYVGSTTPYIEHKSRLMATMQALAWKLRGAGHIEIPDITLAQLNGV